MHMQITKRIPKWQNPQAGQAKKKILYAGIHIVADFWFGKSVEDPKIIERLLRGAAKESLSAPLKISIHTFSPQGITGLILLAESHISIHSWPEIDYIAIDIFTCGKKSKPQKALEFLKREIKPKQIVAQEIKRGKMSKEILKKL